jgi:hypothetical protein
MFVTIQVAQQKLPVKGGEMSNWKVTWWDGAQLRETIVYSDAYNVANYAISRGVFSYSILKMERVPANFEN